MARQQRNRQSKHWQGRQERRGQDWREQDRDWEREDQSFRGRGGEYPGGGYGAERYGRGAYGEGDFGRGFESERSGRGGFGEREFGHEGRGGYGRSEFGRGGYEGSYGAEDDQRDARIVERGSSMYGAYGREFPARRYPGGYGGYPGTWNPREENWRGQSRRDRNWRDEGERGMWDRASDEVASWFGDEEAERRREMDRFRGHGPKNYARSEERIREDVCDRLTVDASVDASDIEVKVAGNEVTLSGTVPNRMQRRRAEDCAEDVSGVKHVQNNLRVKEQEFGSQTVRKSTL
jgi:osmotically-inducible protein OsmY